MEDAEKARESKPRQSLMSVPQAPDIDHVVAELRELQRSATLDLTFHVGELIVTRFFGGDLHEWRKRGSKDASLRKLAEHEDLPFSASTLYRSVAIYEVAHRLGGVATWQQWKHVGASHIRTVLSLPAKTQDRLIKDAEKNEWTVRELQEQARNARKGPRSKGGRKPLPGVVKEIRHLKQAVDGSEGVYDDDSVKRIQPEDVRELLEVLNHVTQRCAELRQLLEGRLAALPLVGASGESA